MAAKADTWMPLYVGSYLANTSHLTTEQHGAYFLLLLAAWKRGGRLPADEGQLASVCKLTPQVWRKHRGVLLEFFALDGDAWVHDRVSEEREKAQRLSDIRQEAGRKGGRPKKQDESTEKPIGLANEKQTETPLPSPTPDGVKKDADASSVPGRGLQVWDDVFTAAWEAYPKLGRDRSMSRAKCWPLWRQAAQQAGSPERLLAAVKRYVAEDKTHKGECGPPAFDRWLKAGRWEHFLAGEVSPRIVTVFPDVEIRAAIISAKGEGWANSWLDPCGWEPKLRVIIPRNGLAAQKLRSEVQRVLSAQKASVEELAA